MNAETTTHKTGAGKTADVKIGSVYKVKVADRIVRVRIETAAAFCGWWGRNLSTGCEIHIKTASMLIAKDEGRGQAATILVLLGSLTSRRPGR